MPDRRNRQDIEENLITLCAAAALPYAGKENGWQGLAIDSLWNERGRRYRVVEVDARGGERCPFGYAYAPAGELYARLQFAEAVLRYADQADAYRLTDEDRDIAHAERAATR